MKVLKNVVGECQNVFVEDKQIVDAAFVANEVGDELRYKNLEGTLCKLDMEKICDHVN